MAKPSMSEDYFLWFYSEINQAEFYRYIDQFRHIDLRTLPEEERQKWISDGSSEESLFEQWIEYRLKLYKATDEITNDPRIIHVFNCLEFNDDLCSHFFIRIICASYPAITDWIIDQEVDVIMKRIATRYNAIKSNPRSTTYLQRYQDLVKSLFISIFGSNNIDVSQFTFSVVIRGGYPEITSKFGLYWSCAEQFIESINRYTMKSGMIIVPFKQFKDKFEQTMYGRFIHKKIRVLFKQSFARYAENISDPDKEKYRAIASDIFTDNIDHGNFVPTITNIEEIMTDSPLCISELDRKIRAGEMISYDERLQLSSYLKVFLDLDEQNEYWYRRNPHNTHFATMDEFLSGTILGTWLPHLYGLSGGGHDYQPMKCRTCRVKGFCFFKQDPNLIESKLKRMYEASYNEHPSDFQRMLTRIIATVRQRKYSIACAFEIAMRTHKSAADLHKWGDLFMNHPIYTYYRRCRGIRLGEEPPAQTPVIPSGQNDTPRPAS